MFNLKIATIALGLNAVLFSAASAASLFTSEADFAGATTDVTVENFDVDIAQPSVFGAPTITFPDGTTSTGFINERNRVEDGVFLGSTRNGRDATFDRTTVFDFGRDVTAFGGFFIGASDIILSGDFDGTSQSFLLGDLRDDDGFIGLTSTTGFSTVTFSTDAGGVSPFGPVAFLPRQFRLDNLALGDAQPAPVPLPASALMLLTAFAGLGAANARRRRN